MWNEPLKFNVHVAEAAEVQSLYSSNHETGSG